MYLEACVHRESSFVTLTYSPEKLPPGGNLVPRDVQLWLKRLRKSISKISSDLKLRFFLCGEYGDRTWRPHYHACLFGVGVSLESTIRASWPQGFVTVYEFDRKMAQYTAGYVVKKMTRRDDPRLEGRHPEFARMSLRPGIGAGAMEVLKGPLLTPSGVRAFLSDGLNGDVPQSLKLGREDIPLARYLRKRLRDEIGMTDEWAQEVVKNWSLKKSQEMLAMCVGAGGSPADAKRILFEKNLGRMQRLEARQKITWGKKL